MNTEKKGVAPASPFSYATKQPGGDKTHRPPDTAARLRPTKQPVYFTTEQPGGDNKSVICGDANLMIIDTSIYHFGVLISNVHMAWTRAVCGRIKSDYRYSKDVVYNNFPWPTPTEQQKAKIEQTAQAILDARALYPDCSLADLYDEVTMPPELRKAHQQNDRAVMQAYGFDIKTTTETSCVAQLMKLYQQLTS